MLHDCGEAAVVRRNLFDVVVWGWVVAGVSRGCRCSLGGDVGSPQQKEFSQVRRYAMREQRKGFRPTFDDEHFQAQVGAKAQGSFSGRSNAARRRSLVPVKTRSLWLVPRSDCRNPPPAKQETKKFIARDRSSGPPSINEGIFFPQHENQQSGVQPQEASSCLTY